MTILIDPPFWPAHGRLWSHLVSDSNLVELHSFAHALGVPRRGFDLDHYDVPEELFSRALELGAVPVTGREVVLALKRAGLRVKQAERESTKPIHRRRYLQDEWRALGSALGIENASRLQSWNRLGVELLSRWNEPHRAYHDERHLEDILLALNQLEVGGYDVSVETLLSAWFHDAIYEGKAGQDEMESADFAAYSVLQLGFGRTIADRIAEMILATDPSRASKLSSLDQDLKNLLDADLWVFASKPLRYKQYASDVRKEYAHIKDSDFIVGRSEILKNYIAQPDIYRTDFGKTVWEPYARKNVLAEISNLNQGLITFR